MMAFSQLFFRGSALLLVILVAACTTYTPPETEPAPVEKRPAPAVMVPPAPKPPQPSPPRRAPSATAAWQPLLEKAEQATQRGDYEEALSLLERAQRIEPDSGEVYLCMARTHQAKGDAAQARATAERGLLYCSSNAMCDALRNFAR